jgi:CubicO group peptidase (beta-lactamase class C family)
MASRSSLIAAMTTCAWLMMAGWSAAAPVQDDWAPADGSGVRLAMLAALPAAIARGEFPKTTSVLVIRHGRLAYEAYFGAGGLEVLNDTRSATKSITSLAVGALIADGRIHSVDDPAFGYLTDLQPFANPSAEKSAITLADLLTMSSALSCNDDDDKSPGQEDKMHRQQRWARWIADLPTQPDYHRDAGSGRGPFAYCTAGAVLLGQIIQRAAGEPVDSYIERKVLGPLGIAKRQWSRSPAGEVMTGGGLQLRSRDLAKLAWMMVDHGRWRGRQIIPASWIDAALTPRTKPDARRDYGYLFWRTDYATACGPVSGWYMAGNGGNAVVMLRNLDAAVVITRTNYNSRGMHEQTTDLIQRYVLPSMACGPGA